MKHMLGVICGVLTSIYIGNISIDAISNIIEYYNIDRLIGIGSLYVIGYFVTVISSAVVCWIIIE